MHVDVTGIVAVGGFWTFWIAMALKKPLISLVEKSKSKNSDVTALNQRVEHLENLLETVHHEMIELKESNDFAHKLIASEKQQPEDRPSTVGGTISVTNSARERSSVKTL